MKEMVLRHIDGKVGIVTGRCTQDGGLLGYYVYLLCPCEAMRGFNGQRGFMWFTSQIIDILSPEDVALYSDQHRGHEDLFRQAKESGDWSEFQKVLV